MTVSDPIADMLTRIRNGLMARHDGVLMPSSRVKIAIAKILKAEGFITDYEVLKEKSYKVIKIHLRYIDKSPGIAGIERASKPGLRLYVQRNEISRVHGGAGIAIISTPKGVMTGFQAWRQGLGGELLCYVW